MLNITQCIFSNLHIYRIAKRCENLGMENKEIRKSNLENLIDEHLKNAGSTKASFAELCGISPAQLSQMLKGVRNVGDRMARKIESAMNLPNGWMDAVQGHTTHSDEIEFAGSIRSGYVPVVGEAILGVDGSVDMIEFRAGWLRIYSGDKDAYGLKVKGDSMWPRIQSGEYVVIEPNTCVHIGDEVFVRTKDGHNMIKIMNKTRDGDFQFTSVNSDHRPITLSPELVEKMHYVSAIVKHTRYVDQDDVPRVDSSGI